MPPVRSAVWRAATLWVVVAVVAVSFLR